MNKKTIIITILAIIVSFALGLFYGKSSSSKTANFPSENRQFGQNRNGLGGFSSGEIISKDENGITLKLQNGGSQIVIISSDTSINKQTSGSKDDLVIGTKITVNGTQNTDKSITAKSIQIRPTEENMKPQL